jgi:hypothetical protein
MIGISRSGNSLFITYSSTDHRIRSGARFGTDGGKQHGRLWKVPANERRAYTSCIENFRIRAFFLIIELFK